MSKEETGIKLFTREEAESLLPKVRRSLIILRDLKNRLLRLQAQVEIEQMTGAGPDGLLRPETARVVQNLLQELQRIARALEEEWETLEATGAQLKDLEEGLVDFYSRRNGELVFLCWKEGEEHITHWHALDAGFRGRRPL